MKLKNVFVCFFFFSLVLQVSAQQLKLSGTVRDEKGEPLLGVFILIKGTQQGTSTDFDGNYVLNAKVGDVLSYSFLGMKTVEKKVLAGASQVDVVLKEDIQQLEGTVVVGYGSRKVASRTVASVAQVQGKELTKISTANAMEGLQGRVAGLVITNKSGKPGATSEVLIHGLGSFTAIYDGDDKRASAPLYIMDGVPVNGEVMTMLNPSDIESITVLKDAASTSIYGARAANGVILITTKRGKYNERTNISINHSLSVTTFTNATNDFFNDLVSPREYMDYYIIKDPDGLRRAATRLGYRETDPKAIADRILEENPYNTRWDKVFFKDFVPVLRTDVSVSGGMNNTAYYLSLGYLNQEGMQPHTGFERYNLNLNVDTKITDWLKAGLSVSLGHGESKSVPSESAELNSKVIRLPFYSPVDKNGKRKNFITSLLGDREGFLHPDYEAEKYKGVNYTDEIMPVGFLTFEPFDGLTFKSQLGIQYVLGEGETKSPLPSFIDYRSGGSVGTGATTRNSSKELQKTYTNQLEYRFNIAQRNDFTVLLGQESYENSGSSFSASSKGQPSDAFTMLSHGKERISVSDGYSKSTFNSLFARVEYAYAGKYFLDLSGRRDGSSAFRRNHQYDNFWAVGAMWKVKQERFLENLSWLTDLNVRFSTGLSGNSRIGDYRNALYVQAPQQYVYQGQIGYMLVLPPGNADLKWEQQRKTTFGVNMVLNHNTSINVEYYNRVTYRILSTRKVNSALGFHYIPDNMGDMQNQGIDITLSSSLYKSANKDFAVRGNFNLNYNSPKVLKIVYAAPYTIKYDDYVGYKVGGGLDWMMPLFKGVNDSGDAEWYLPGNDKFEKQTDDTKATTVFDKWQLTQTTGKPRYAPINGGFSLDATYKSFALDLSFAYSLGRYQINEDRAILENPTYFGRQTFSKKALNYWKQPGDNTDLPKISSRNLMLRDSRLLENASFLRLRSIGLSYTLPQESLGKEAFFKELRLTASAYNIFTLTRFSGVDPEFGGGIASGGYPPTRQYSFGVGLKF